MEKVEEATTERLKEHIAHKFSEYHVAQGSGSGATVEISLMPSVARTFRAHWTGFRLAYSRPTIVLLAWLHDGSFWSEGYISTDQPSYVLNFRKTPHKSRGTGAERPDDKFTPPQAKETAMAQRRELILAGLAADEEIIRYEDFDSPAEAVDQFFNYTEFYCLRSVDLDWSSFGYVADPSLGWDDHEESAAATPFGAAIDEGLKRSDILWLWPDTSPDRSVPCWFFYSKDQKLYILSAEPEQIIPDAHRVRRVKVMTRRKGRDARMAAFEASVRVIGPEDKDEFERVGALLVAKRQSATGTVEENVSRWMAGGVILELTPSS